jgi:hypothetical protein
MREGSRTDEVQGDGAQERGDQIGRPFKEGKRSNAIRLAHVPEHSYGSWPSLERAIWTLDFMTADGKGDSEVKLSGVKPDIAVHEKEPLAGQGLETFPDAAVYGQWIIQNRICLVHRVSQSHATPSGILPMMGTTRSGRRYLRLDAMILAQKLGVTADELWTANKRRSLDLTISYVQAQRAMKLTFQLGSFHYVLTLRLPADALRQTPPHD